MADGTVSTNLHPRQEMSPSTGPSIRYARAGLSKTTSPLAMGVDAFTDLLRSCDSGQGRAAACALFWLVGAKQVGKAAITGWRDLLTPALSDQITADTPVMIWPFDGALDALVERPGIVVAETYPGEFYHHLSLHIAEPECSKRRRGDRAAEASRMLRWTHHNGVRISPLLHDAINDGFGERQSGEDRFDAVVGLFGMLNVALGNRSPDTPGDECTRIVGWILGQQPRQHSRNLIHDH